MNNQPTDLEIEAATFRHLRDFLREHTEVQNIDLMNLAGFCRNCLAKWYRAEAEQRGVTLDYEAARELIYGMPYSDWRARFQTDSTHNNTPRSTRARTPSSTEFSAYATRFNRGRDAAGVRPRHRSVCSDELARRAGTRGASRG